MKLAGLERILILLYAVSLPLSLTLSWALLIAGMVSSVALALWKRKQTGAFDPCTWPPLTLPLGLFALAVALSGLAAGGPAEACASVATLRPLVVYFWAHHVFSRDPGAVSPAVQILLCLAGVAGLWSAVQQLTGFHPFGYQWLQGTGFLGGPMAFAGQMQIFSALALGLLLAGGYTAWSGRLSRRAAFAAVTAANLLGVFFAGERSAWLGAVAGIIAVAALVSWRVVLKSVLALALVAALAWAFVPVVQVRLAPLAAWQTDVSARVRVFLWKESIERFKQSPLTGLGIRNFPRFDIPEAIVPGRSKDLNHAHSNYIHILATTGVLGLCSYLYLWVSALLLALRLRRKDGYPLGRALAIGIFGGIVALCVSGIFEYNFGTSQVRLAEWFVLAMLVAVPASKPD